MAALHKQMAEEKSLELTSAVAELHAQNQVTPTQLDLHYHNITEASTILQTFIDKNISRLRDIKKPYEELSIITGRGAHSKNGIATLKLMTIQILKERNLK
jgi:DNA-nicking Smr family endonuclease